MHKSGIIALLESFFFRKRGDKKIETKIIKENPVVVDTTPIKDITYRSPAPFISVNPITGEREEVATAAKDIANRRAFSEKSGTPVEQVSAPPLKPATPEQKA